MQSRQILVTRSSMPEFEEYVEEIRLLWESHFLTNMGAKHRELERRLIDYLGIEDIALFVNGHSALECVIEAMDLKGKVITTPFTFASTTHAIVRMGLTPVFADIRADNYTLDPESVEALIDEDVCAIMPVHVYGNICDVDTIEAIAKKHSLKVIYDAAHAFGVQRNGVHVATFGDASMFSFHATKVFNTIEGGAVCFHDHSLKDLLNQWKNFGITGTESVEYIGGNAKMNEFCAAMGICNLRHLPDEISKRKKVAERYWDRLEGVPGIVLSKPEQGITSNYAYMPVLFDEKHFNATRDEVYDVLLSIDIHPRKYFYPLTSDFDCYNGRFDSRYTPVAKYVSDRILTLPMYADLSLDDVDRICDAVVGIR
ncbi:DegT/DnrJ/EryC1/StrS family aminotransferase [Enorma burkinafasonensis]|uniref:DegT/DnrJ/EryC1/StrS family aminotransferase n=1 Tax=Enorma burkinafasonensis TaxID=2590867 RepID=UPI0011A798AF|nr:DegT/DnrJ/EryC1/StrS family aminotransferase [Enorma burkinafasonensis]